MDDGAGGPGEERRHDEPDAFPGTCRGKGEHMLRPVMPDIAIVPRAEENAGFCKETRTPHIPAFRPSGRAIGCDMFLVAGSEDGAGDGGHGREQAAGCRDKASFHEEAGCIGLIGIPPLEKSPRLVDRLIAKLEPCVSESGLIPEFPCNPLGCAPDSCKHDQKADQDLAKEDLGMGHVRGLECSRRRAIVLIALPIR